MLDKMQSVEKIRLQYERRQTTKLDELKALDKRVKRPAQIFAYILGTACTLILGTGMCLAMKIIGNFMIPGIIIGIAGIAMITVNYKIYKSILKSRKARYAEQIFALSDSLLNEDIAQ